MGGHGGLNILPQKKWNVYNFDNREKVRKDEEAAAKEEQLKREQSQKRDSESRLLQLRRARGLDPESAIDAPSSSSSAVAAVELPSSEPKSDSKHINLFDGIRIFDPIEVVEKKKEDEGSKRKKMKTEEVRVVGPEDEKYRLGYGVAGKGVKAPWYAVKPEKEEGEEREQGRSDGGEKTKAKVSGKKTLEELREERLKREKVEKERERALLSQKRGGLNGLYQRMKSNNEEHSIIQKPERSDKKRVHNAVDMGAEKIQSLVCAEDLSIPSFQVIVMSANLGCNSCRDKVSRVLSKITGFKEYTVDVRKKQVTIKGDVSFLWSTKE